MVKEHSKQIVWWVFIVISLVATVTPLPSGGGYGFSYVHNAMVLVAIAFSLLFMVFVKEVKLDLGFLTLASVVTLMFAPSIWTSSNMSAVILRYSFILITLFWVFLLPDVFEGRNKLKVLRSLLVLIFAQAIFALFYAP